MTDISNDKIVQAAEQLKALLPKVRNAEKKACDDRLFARFKPIFSPENLPKLTTEQFRSFTQFSENEHWTNIQRHNGKILADLEKLRLALQVLTDESKLSRAA